MDIRQQLVVNTFYVTYVMLMTTGVITFIEAMRTDDQSIRHLLNVETCISVIAAFFYSQFINMITNAPNLPYQQINLTRYTDWFMTTPFMLLSLCIFLSREIATPFYLSTFIAIILMNYGMLTSGYVGEMRIVPRPYAATVGFIFLVALASVIWFTFIEGNNVHWSTRMVFIVFMTLWSLYGIAYFVDDVSKNVAYNILDVTAKCLFGLFFWLYYTNILSS